MNFRAIGFHLSNGVTDTLESSSILIYSDLHDNVKSWELEEVTLKVMAGMGLL